MKIDLFLIFEVRKKQPLIKHWARRLTIPGGIAGVRVLETRIVVRRLKHGTKARGHRPLETTERRCAFRRGHVRRREYTCAKRDEKYSTAEKAS